MTEFSGRVAIVTGSSSGIGEAVSNSLPGESCYLRADISNHAEAHARSTTRSSATVNSTS